MLHQLLVHEPVIYRHWYVWSRSYQQDKVFCYKSSALVGRAGISHFSSLTYGLRLGKELSGQSQRSHIKAFPEVLLVYHQLDCIRSDRRAHLP